MRRFWLHWKHRIVMWLWRDNEWTGLIDSIDKATKEISDGKYDQILIPLDFRFLKHNTFNLVVKKT